jgi:hypothetical protein
VLSYYQRACMSVALAMIVLLPGVHTIECYYRIQPSVSSQCLSVTRQPARNSLLSIALSHRIAPPL